MYAHPKVIVNYATNDALAQAVCAEIGAKGGIGIAMKANCANAGEIQQMFTKVNSEV